jgi:hypothetical protein
MELNANVTPELIKNLISVTVEANELTADQVREVYKALPNGKNMLDGRIIRFVNTSFGKLIRHKGFDVKQVIPCLKQVFDNALYIYSSNEQHRPNHKPHPNFKQYHNYLAKIQLVNATYYVRLTIQELDAKPRTIRNGFIPSELHSIFVSNVQLYEKNHQYSCNLPDDWTTNGAFGGFSETGHAHFHDAKLQQFLEAASFYHK